MSGIRIIDGVKAVRHEGLWKKVDNKNQVWREGEFDWFRHDTPASDVLEAIAKAEEILPIMTGRKSREKAKRPPKQYVKSVKVTAGQRVREFVLGTDESHTVAEIAAVCKCSRSVCDTAMVRMLKADEVEEGFNNGRTWISRPSKCWKRRQPK